MKNVWLAQPTNLLSESVFFPYSVGVLAAYAWQFDAIKKEFQLNDFILLMRPIKEVLEEIDDPYLVGFSCYMWNIEYNLQLARAIKERWKSCIIVFGGQQIPPNGSFLDEYSFIDYLILGEGECAFSDLLFSCLGKISIEEVPGLAYRSDKTVIITKKRILLDLSDCPSPYLSGLFDYLFTDPRYCGLKFDAIMETNRGCPYKCLYCSWGDNTAPVRQFSMDRIQNELNWFSDHKVEYCICIDGNFGMFDRDEIIAEYVVSLKKKNGFPKKFETTSDKNKADRNFRIHKKLHSVQLDRGVCLAVQSFTPQVLSIVGRRNITADTFRSHLKEYRSAGIDTYTDIILGLPGESFESFCRSLFNVVDAGQHYRISVYCCEMLPNAPMCSREIMEKYRIKTIKSYLHQTHSRLIDTQLYSSRSEIIVSTNTMSKRDWRNMYTVAILVQALHCYGLLRFVAVYLRQAQEISYYDFYMAVFNYINNENPYLKSIIERVTFSFSGFLAESGDLWFVDERFGEVNLPFDEGFFLCCVSDGSRFYREIKPCLARFFSDPFLFEDLFNYQTSIINMPFAQERCENFIYDWNAYFKDMYAPLPHVPIRRDNRLLFVPDKYSDLSSYAREIVWYGKRNERTVISNITSL